MTDPIDTAREEGIALGLAMAGSAFGEWYSEATTEAIKARILALAPIPPHVAAARVLLDDLKLALGTDGSAEGLAAGKRWNEGIEPFSLWPFVKHLRAALEHIAKEGE